MLRILQALLVLPPISIANQQPARPESPFQLGLGLVIGLVLIALALVIARRNNRDR